MTAHKHAAMIKAKADNMELVVFCRDSYDKSNEWVQTSQMPFQVEFEYFLCLPQHKEACLHWLNGGDVECNSKFTNGWEDCHDIKSITWSISIGLMRQDAKYRIKPRKEKRWITYNPTSRQVYNCGKSQIPAEGFQIIEIEVEI